MTRGEMKEAIRYAVGLREPEEQGFIEREIHLAIIDVLRRTSCYVQCIDADVPDGKTRFELGPSIQKIVHIYRNGQRLSRVTQTELPSYGSGVFAQVGQIVLVNDPFAAGEELQFYAVPRPPAMTDDDDLIEDEQWGGIVPEYQDAVELCACSKLASRSDDGTSGMGAQYMALYIGQDSRSGRIAEIRRAVNRATGQTLGQAQVAYRP